MGAKEYESIPDLINSRLIELEWSGARAAREAESLGIPLATSTINRVRQGRLNLSASRLGMLAQVLRLPRSLVMEVAGRQKLPEFIELLPRDVDRLTQAEREVVLSLIGHFLAGKDDSADSSDPPESE